MKKSKSLNTKTKNAESEINEIKWRAEKEDYKTQEINWVVDAPKQKVKRTKKIKAFVKIRGKDEYIPNPKSKQFQL